MYFTVSLPFFSFPILCVAFVYQCLFTFLFSQSPALIGYPTFGALCGLTGGVFWKWLFSGERHKSIPSDTPRQTLITSASVIMILLHAVGLFSNSYIESQDKTVRFLANSLLLLYVSPFLC